MEIFCVLPLLVIVTFTVYHKIPWLNASTMKKIASENIVEKREIAGYWHFFLSSTGQGQQAYVMAWCPVVCASVHLHGNFISSIF